MKTKLAPSIELDFKPIRERRRRARVKLSCFILVRPLEPEPEYFENIILADESSRNGLSFRTDNVLYCERMRLLVTYPYSLHPNAINQEYIAEVVRTKALADGRYRVAVRLLTTAKLSIPPSTKLRSSNLWNVLWQRARVNGNATKLEYACSANRSR
jgi:hypothetical protein